MIFFLKKERVISYQMLLKGRVRWEFRMTIGNSSALGYLVTPGSSVELWG